MFTTAFTDRLFSSQIQTHRTILTNHLTTYDETLADQYIYARAAHATRLPASIVMLVPSATTATERRNVKHAPARDHRAITSQYSHVSVAGAAGRYPLHRDV